MLAQRRKRRASLAYADLKALIGPSAFRGRRRHKRKALPKQGQSNPHHSQKIAKFEKPTYGAGDGHPNGPDLGEWWMGGKIGAVRLVAE